MQLTRPLDSVDRRIIALLRENAKRTFADIGADVGLSSTAVKRRVDRLHHDGVIVGYGARIDPLALGEGIEALIEVYCAERVAPADVGRSLTDLEQVVSSMEVDHAAVDRAGPGDDVALKVDDHVRDHDLIYREM